jgi:phage terminase large subunit-like protein
MTAALSPSEIDRYRAELTRLRRLRELESQRITQAWAGAPPFYCPRPACDGRPHDAYTYPHAREVQRPPEGDWSTWWLRGGRGAGKTRAGSEWLKEQGRHLPGSRGALVGPTLEDVRLTMVEGDSGVLSVLPPSVLRGGSVEDSWNRGPCELYLANGTRWKGFTSEKPGRLRGPQHHYAWGDEPAEWDDAAVDPLTTTKGTTMSNLEFGLRLGQDPRLLLTGTPKTVLLIRRLLWRDGDRDKGPAPGVVIGRSSTYDNLANLAPVFRERVLESYEGTTLGMQELEAEYLDETPGALWKREQLQRDRVKDKDPADLARIAVGVDPSGGAGEQGIVVVGRDSERHGYILDDRSDRRTPEGWGRAAVLAWHDWQADSIVVETNFGGDMAKSTLQVAASALLDEGAIDRMPYIKVTHSSRGKQVRAEPVAAASEQGRIHLVGMHARLEDQLVGWVPGESDYSPDRLDAMVFAAVELGLAAFAGRATFSGARAAAAQIGA